LWEGGHGAGKALLPLRPQQAIDGPLRGPKEVVVFSFLLSQITNHCPSQHPTQLAPCIHPSPLAVQIEGLKSAKSTMMGDEYVDKTNQPQLQSLLAYVMLTGAFCNYMIWIDENLTMTSHILFSCALVSGLITYIGFYGLVGPSFLEQTRNRKYEEKSAAELFQTLNEGGIIVDESYSILWHLRRRVRENRQLAIRLV
jgi:hypothetical protein